MILFFDNFAFIGNIFGGILSFQEMEVTRMRSTRICGIAAALTLVFACGALVTSCGKKEAAGKQAELTVLCGSSFVKPMEKLCAEFTADTGIKTVTSVGGSEDLLPLVKLGKKGDIYVTHDPFLDYTRDANALSEHVHVGFVAPVLAVQKGNPKGIKSIEDLAGADLKVALTDCLPRNSDEEGCGTASLKTQLDFLSRVIIIRPLYRLP
jgi:ABC-type molybdate transport system substrate-binding protein